MKGEVTLRQRGPGERHVVQQWSDCEEESETEDDSGEGGDDRFDGRNRRDLARSGADQPHRGEALFAPDGRQSARRRNQDQNRQHERHGPADQDEFQNWPAPDHALAAIAIRQAAVDRPDLDGSRLLRELADAVTDDDDQRVRRRQSRATDGAHQPTGVAITQLVGGLGAKQAHQLGRGEVLARTRQAGHSGRDGRARPGRRDVDLVDELTPERVGARFPPQAAGGRGRRCRLHRRVQPGTPIALGVETIDAGQGGQQQADAEGDRSSGDEDPQEGFTTTPQGQPEAEPDHAPTATGLATRPSRTITSRSA